MKDLATLDETPAEVQLAIRTLLGLELPTRLQRDLDIVVSRVEKGLVPPEAREGIEQMRAVSETIRGRIDSGKRDAGEWKAGLERLRRQLLEKKSRFLAEGGQLAQKREDLVRDLARTEERISVQRQSMREMAGTELPLSLVAPLLRRTTERAEIELGFEERSRLVQLLEQRDHAVLESLENQCLDTEV